MAPQTKPTTKPTNNQPAQAISESAADVLAKLKAAREERQRLLQQERELEEQAQAMLSQGGAREAYEAAGRDAKQLEQQYEQMKADAERFWADKVKPAKQNAHKLYSTLVQLGLVPPRVKVRKGKKGETVAIAPPAEDAQ